MTRMNNASSELDFQHRIRLAPHKEPFDCSEHVLLVTEDQIVLSLVSRNPFMLTVLVRELHLFACVNETYKDGYQIDAVLADLVTGSQGIGGIETVWSESGFFLDFSEGGLPSRFAWLDSPRNHLPRTAEVAGPAPDDQVLADAILYSTDVSGN